MMNILLIGQKWLASEVLKSIVSGHHVTTLAPDKCDSFYKSSGNYDVCKGVHGKYVTTDSVPSGTDLIVCAHSHAFVTKSAIAKSTHGAIGYHPSLLPKHGGKNSVQDTILMGDKITSGSVYWLSNEMDGGDIMLQSKVAVKSNDSVKSLWVNALAPLGVELLTLAVDLINHGHLLKSPQR